MSPIVMNILAYLAILAFLGLIGVTVWLVMTALGMYHKAKATMVLFNPAKQSVMQTVSVVKGIGARSKQRISVIGVHGRHAAGSVNAVKDDFVEAAHALDFETVRDSAQGAADSVRKGMQTVDLLRQVLRAASDAR